MKIYFHNRCIYVFKLVYRKIIRVWTVGGFCSILESMRANCSLSHATCYPNPDLLVKARIFIRKWEYVTA